MTARLDSVGESVHPDEVVPTHGLSGAPWRPVDIGFFDGETRDAAYRRSPLTPMGKAPVSVDGDTVLPDSGVVAQDLAERSAHLDDGSPNEVLRRLLRDNHEGSAPFGTLRCLKNFLPEGKGPVEVIALLQAWVDAARTTWDEQRGGRDGLVSDQATIADLPCCDCLSCLEPFGLVPSRHHHIGPWLKHMASLPGRKHPYDLMPGNSLDRAAKEDP